MNNHTIFFYATLGDISQPAFGGGEVGNRRTLGLLKQIGYNVVAIPKYARNEGTSILALSHKFLDIFANLCTFLFILLKGKRKNSIVHIAGFSGSMVYWTFVLITISKLLGYKTVYELRGGGIIEHYHSGSKLYKWSFVQSVRKADCIFSQGEDNRSLILGIDLHKDFYYYPNYVEHDFSPKEYPSKPKESLNLIYFGRLSRTKNIELIIDLFEDVATRIDSVVTLTIIGNPESEEYFNRIKNRVVNSPFNSSITLKTRCPHDVLKQYLADKHFYIFPTKENGEGHSNALTEAMTWGIIPIATDQGFNKNVINCEELIVNKMSKEAFSNIIVQLFEEKRIDEYSRNIYCRAKELYSYESAYNRLRHEYSRLFGCDDSL